MSIIGSFGHCPDNHISDHTQHKTLQLKSSGRGCEASDKNYLSAQKGPTIVGDNTNHLGTLWFYFMGFACEVKSGWSK